MLSLNVLSKTRNENEIKKTREKLKKIGTKLRYEKNKELMRNIIPSGYWRNNHKQTNEDVDNK